MYLQWYLHFAITFVTATIFLAQPVTISAQESVIETITFDATTPAVQNASVETVKEPAPTRMTPELLLKLGRLGGATISADGKKIAYTVRRYDLGENKGRSTLHVLDMSTSIDKPVVSDWPSIGAVQFSKLGDSEQLVFLGKQPEPENSDDSEESGNGDEDESTPEDKASTATQAWTVNIESGDLVQLTAVEDGIANLKVSPVGDRIAFTADIKMDKEVTEIYEDLPKADARIIDALMYRHWNAWHDYKYSHLHVASINENGLAGTARDLMDGIKADCPVPPFGGSEQYNWSPDGKEIAFTMKNVERWAESTNSDVYVINIEGDTPPRNITQGMEGYDNDPVYSPDGKYLAFQSMERSSFESDKNRIMLIDRSSSVVRDLSAGLDQTSHSLTWMPDSKGLLFVSEYRGTNQIFSISVDSPSAKKISDGRFNFGIVDIMPDGKSALISQQSMLRPNELALLKMADSTVTVASHINDEIYETLELPRIEERWVDATDGKKIHCWVIHPPNFDPSAEQKWPLLTYFQGGPQGQIGQWFSYRWNFHLMAAQGYVVVAPNRRGLPGFGRAWNDQISGDWGGQAMKDILSATDSMTQESYIDNERVAGVGASFGGYTAYWMMGNHDNRYCALIAHCGVFNLESMYGSTEELFFVNWDMGGPYWSGADVQQKYNQFSPHRFIGKWNTPLLVIHGEKDFRVPITQGMEAFTAAQVKGIPSRFLYFPEEGHWVQSPQNSVLWQRVFYDWLDRYCKNPEPPKPTPADSKP